jgi:hypothetical protein
MSSGDLERRAREIRKRVKEKKEFLSRISLSNGTYKK